MAIQFHSWREKAATVFQCEKQPAHGTRGIVVTNHPLASSAAAEMLLAGGNAFDAASAAMFALTVVEPMMVGILGGGMALIRHADGRTRVLDGNCVVPGAMPADFFKPLPMPVKEGYAVVDRANTVGVTSVAVPGALPAWCEMQERWGTFSLSDVLEPAIRLAQRGFFVTPYLSTCIGDAAPDLVRDPAIAAWLMPDGTPRRAGERLTNSAYADALGLIARVGPGALHGGPLGDAFVSRLERDGGLISTADLSSYRSRDVPPVIGDYRGWKIMSAPPPSAAGVHLIQMLKILEGFDLRHIGFGTSEMIHLLAETMKIAFADRMDATADPAFFPVPAERLISAEYAQQRRRQIDPERAQVWSSEVASLGGPNTTHITISDADGNVVSSTQTISSLFGARILVPETGMVPNNYMAVFDPVPGRTQSLQPGKRVTTSMGPTLMERDGILRFALGLPGGKRIFPSILQTIINLVDHEMGLQEAVEAPRLFSEGQLVEIEDAVPERVLRRIRAKGHEVTLVPHVAGGMNGIAFHDDGSATGAGCWRADGTVIAIGGGLARQDVRFWPDSPPAGLVS